MPRRPCWANGDRSGKTVEGIVLNEVGDSSADGAGGFVSQSKQEHAGMGYRHTKRVVPSPTPTSTSWATDPGPATTPTMIVRRGRRVRPSIPTSASSPSRRRYIGVRAEPGRTVITSQGRTRAAVGDRRSPRPGKARRCRPASPGNRRCPGAGTPWWPAHSPPDRASPGT
jgi:hypothetical protein